ncbi:MAG: AsmA family protein, partial [Kiloniellaceae bacterium]
MKKFLIGLAAVVVLVVVALFAVPALIPVETYKARIEDAAREATGRALTLKGDLKLSLLPRVELEAADVAFANAPGARAPNMASLERLVLQLQVFPLLSGQIKVDSFVLVKPVINLEVDKAGRPNWRFALAAAAAPAEAAAPATGEALSLPDLSLGDVRIEDGRVTYRDGRGGQTFEASAINMTVSLPNMDGPVRAEGSLVWNGEKLTLTLETENLRGLAGGEATPLRLALDAKPIKVQVDGQVTNAAPPRRGGRLDLDVPSIRALAAWSGSPIEGGGSGLGPLKIAGKIDATDTRFAFSEAVIALDGMNAKGDLSADIGGAKPDLKGRLDVDRVDLNVYMPPAGTPTDSAGEPAPAGWSDAPIALDGLKAANVDFTLTVGEILAQDIKVGRSAVRAVLKDGLLKVDLSELNLYGGTGTGRITVDARGPVPAVTKTFAIQGIQARPFLTDAAGFERLEGVGRMDISIATKGRGQKAMVEALDGKGAVKFENGAIVGINLAAMARNVGSAFLDPGADKTQKTDFAELSGTFTIDKGQLSNKDLLLLNPLIRLTGAGTVDLPARTLKYRVEPKVVASVEGQGGAAGAAGIAVPVIIEGPWDNLSYKPDLAGLATGALADPTKAVEGAQGAVE